MQCAYECAVLKLSQTSVRIQQNKYRPVSCSSSQNQEPHLCGGWTGSLPEFSTTFHVTPLCKIPKPTTTFLNCILYTLLMYQQHILSLHLICLHQIRVAVYCTLSQLHLHLHVLLDQYVPLGHLLDNGYTLLYQKAANISARYNKTFLISDTIHCLPFHPMFCKHGCHNYSRLLTVALLYIKQHTTFLQHFLRPHNYWTEIQTF